MPLSFRDLMEADGVYMAEDENGFSEPVAQWPKGTEGAKRSGRGIWTPDLSPTRDASNQAEQTTLGGTLRVVDYHATKRPRGFTCDGEDVWVIGGERFATLTVSDVDAGWRTLTLTRVKKVSTGRARGRL